MANRAQDDKSQRRVSVVRPYWVQIDTSVGDGVRRQLGGIDVVSARVCLLRGRDGRADVTRSPVNWSTEPTLLVEE